MKTILAKILVPISIGAVIYANYLAATGAIGDITPAYISDKYPTYITPAGYAFSIWGLIYLGAVSFSFYQLFRSNSKYLDGIRTMFILSCAANIAWIFAWHNQLLGLSTVAILVLLSSLVLINLKTRGLQENLDIWLIKMPFSIYFGWVSVATVLNIIIYLISTGITIDDYSSTIAACVLLFAIAVIAIIVREKFNIALYPLTVAWAFTAIAVKQSGKTAIVFTCAFCVMALIFSSLTFVLRNTKKLT